MAIKTKIQLANDTKVAWEGSSRELLSGEVAIAYTSDGKAELRFGNNKTYSEAIPLQISADQVIGLNDTITSLSTTHYEVSALTELTATSYVNGDTAVVKAQIADTDKYTYTAYVYDSTASDWKAMDGNYDAENVYFNEDLIYTTAFGALAAVPSTGSATLTAKGRNLESVLKSILAQEKNPSSPTQPSVAATITNGTKEIGSKFTPTWSGATLAAGSYQYGPATGVTAKSWLVSNNKTSETATTTSGSFNEYQLTTDGETYVTTVSANYDAAPNYANTNIGNATTTRIEVGSKSTTGTVTSKYPYYTKTCATFWKDPDSIVADDIVKIVNGVTTVQNGFTKTLGDKPSNVTSWTAYNMQQQFWIAKKGKIGSVSVTQQSPEAPHTVKSREITLPLANNLRNETYVIWYVSNPTATTGNSFKVTFG